MASRCRGVLAPGLCESPSRCSPSLRGERSAERRRGLRGPSSRCERPDTLARRVWVPLRSGTRAFRRSTTVFVRPCLTTSGRRLPPGSQRATGGPASSLRTGHSAHRARSEASRESSRLSRTRRHTVPASTNRKPSGMAPLNRQDELYLEQKENMSTLQPGQRAGRAAAAHLLTSAAAASSAIPSTCRNRPAASPASGSRPHRPARPRAARPWPARPASP
jgi:hypothetical protein